MRAFKGIGLYFQRWGSWLLAFLMVFVLVQPKADVVNNRVVITLGTPEAYAAGTADYSLDGTNDNVEIQTALNALPSQGGLLHFKVGTYNLSANVTRGIGNVTIEGEGIGTKFVRNGSAAIFVAGGNNWVFRDLAVDSNTSISMNGTTGWKWYNVYDQQYPWDLRTANSSYINGNITATTGNITGQLTVANITARDATVIVATANATAAEKAIANYVLTGTNDEVTLITAFNTLPEHGGTAAAGTKTGHFKVIGKGNINLGALLDFPPMQDIVIEFPAINMNGAGYRFDSYMNAVIKMPISTNTTNGTSVVFYPRTAGPDNIIIGGPIQFEAYSLAATNGTLGVSWNNSASTNCFNRGTYKFDEGPYPIGTSVGGACYYTTAFQVPNDSAWFPLHNNIILSEPVTSRVLKTTTTTIAGGPAVALNWTTVVYDPYSSFNISGNASTLTCRVPGFYTIGANLIWSSNTTSVDMYLAKNGNNVLARVLTPVSSTAAQFDQHVAAGAYLNVGDTIQVYCRPLQNANDVVGGGDGVALWWVKN